MLADSCSVGGGPSFETVVGTAAAVAAVEWLVVGGTSGASGMILHILHLDPSLVPDLGFDFVVANFVTLRFVAFPFPRGSFVDNFPNSVRPCLAFFERFCRRVF